MKGGTWAAAIWANLDHCGSSVGRDGILESHAGSGDVQAIRRHESEVADVGDPSLQDSDVLDHAGIGEDVSGQVRATRCPARPPPEVRVHRVVVLHGATADDAAATVTRPGSPFAERRAGS